MGYTNEDSYWKVADTTARDLLSVDVQEVGKVCLVLTGSGTRYRAVLPGTGSSCWANADTTAAAAAAQADADTLDTQRVKRVSKTVAFAALTDADGSQTFAFASALPATAVVVGAYIDVTQAFTDGVAGVYTADVGVNGADIDQFIDGASLASIAKVGAPLGVAPCGFQGGVTPAVTVLADVNLNTSTAGSLTAYVLYVEAANL